MPRLASPVRPLVHVVDLVRLRGVWRVVDVQPVDAEHFPVEPLGAPLPDLLRVMPAHVDEGERNLERHAVSEVPFLLPDLVQPLPYLVGIRLAQDLPGLYAPALPVKAIADDLVLHPVVLRVHAHRQA